ncbi:DUF6519 domain-containing protein [Bradyrhizobium sp. Arg816]|uniref:DUF6519 domain-containing protein n=1 Tax=Bradyrhizobium sp. Arg816 TaxID=2998491 RepID=UPI00249DC737|nr:DUF6519 domain-containing protein [Bradyrhizobium sp. Arg816]MDI3560171.1 DUF6519 domain-containing protein [Bradyrhizobium sp. Arg816]
MKGDFTRDSFNAAKQFSRVLMQQGRVTLDADVNEQTAILLRTIRLLARDLIGPFATPRDGGGFKLMPGGDGGFIISAGRYWVDGILVENPINCGYFDQPNWPIPADDLLAAEIKSRKQGFFWIYLDVWERLITAVEDPSIREVALGGPDTAARSKVVWQVRGLPADARSNGLNQRIYGRVSACAAPLAGLPGLSPAWLAARVDPGQIVDDPCILPPTAGYRGVENQLYRVEIHQGGATGTATFKWSRDNGSRLAAWTGDGGGNELLVSDSRGFAAGAWVELTNDVLDLQGLPGAMLQLAKAEPGVLTYDPASLGTTPAPVWTTDLVNPKVRQWDERRNARTQLTNGVITVKEGTAATPLWIDLEDGVQIAFAASGAYRTGDHWLIPARVATGGVEWPADATGKPLFEPPRGIEHHYAPLGFLRLGDNATVESCRCEFEPAGDCFADVSLGTGVGALSNPQLRVAETPTPTPTPVRRRPPRRPSRPS